MAHLDLHEQEQVSKIKNFWSDWGKYILAVVIVVVLGVASKMIWSGYAERKASQAAVVYNEFIDAVEASNNEKAYALVKDLESEYPKVEYTTLASMRAASVARLSGQLEQSVDFLEWVVTHTKDAGLKCLAGLRLATVYIDQGKFDEALKILLEKHNPVFDILYFSERGDLYVAEGNLVKARDAYKAALQSAGDNTSAAQVIQLKLDVLGQ